MRNPRVRVAIGLLVAVAAVAVPLTVNSIASGQGVNTPEAAAKAATKRFHSLAAAKAAGWSGLVKDKQGITCIDKQPVGGMGVHYANSAYLTPTNTHLSPTQPQALVYAPSASGKPQLAALEYIVFAKAWSAAGHTGAPKLFGQKFLLTPAGNRFGLPAFWALHIWIWQHNTAGLFQPWNPQVHCK